jgi:phospholipase/lecithinase/hemolysin
MIIQYYVKAVALALVIVIAALAARPAEADPSTEIVVFGDSLSDSGRFFAETYANTGGAIGYPPAPFYYQGRFSDAPLWWEQMAAALGVAAESHAVAGAFSGSGNENDGVFTGSDQYDGIAEQVTAYIAAHPEGINPNALYVVWAGPNDVIDGLNRLLAGDPSGIDPVGTAGNLIGAVDTLGQAGGRFFLVPNMPNLGILPRVLALDVFLPGIADQVAGLSWTYGQTFEAMLDQYLATVPHHVVVVDSFGLLTAVSQAPGAFGMTEVTTACLNRPDVLDPATWTVCGSPTPAGWFFWDDIHPTAQGHAIIGNEFRSEFCGTDDNTPGVQGKPQRQPPPVWRGVCCGSP